ncbi:hypothetical protein JCM21900_004279 [Sporobolomyces salmonicolor]
MFSSLRTSLLRQAPRHQLRHASSSSTSEQAAQKAKDASDKAKQVAGQATQRASQLFGNISQKAGDALGCQSPPPTLSRRAVRPLWVTSEPMSDECTGC